MTNPQPVPVIFRKYRDRRADVVAILPTVPGTNNPGTCASYEHIGQHGSCWPSLLMARTLEAKPEEYAPLLAELERIGYVLRIVRRTHPNHERARCCVLEYQRRHA